MDGSITGDVVTIVLAISVALTFVFGFTSGVNAS